PVRRLPAEGVVLSVTLPGRNPATLAREGRKPESEGSHAPGNMAVAADDRPAWPPQPPARLAWALWTLTILGHAGMLWLDHLVGQAGRPDLAQVLPLLPHYLVGVGAATVGALLVSRRPAHPVGWLLLVFGLASAVTGVAAGSVYYLV